jgi:transcriptional regulator with XRE-family HTH domain
VTLIEAIGIAVRRMREKRGLTQRHLAKLAKCHPMQISKLERGVARAEARREIMALRKEKK